MQINPDTGRIHTECWIPSSNCDGRAHPRFINTLVIHAISLPPREFGGAFVEALFCSELDSTSHPYFATIAKLKVSAHFYIKRTGQLIQFVATHARAWHAGESSFNGYDTVNDFSIGIELEGCDEVSFTDQQYKSLSSLTQALISEYPAITPMRIVGHCDVSPGRKTDPGPNFDWARYKSAL